MTHGIRDMVRSLAWDLGLPVVTYYVLHALGAGDTTALLAGTLAAGARLAWVAVRSRSLSPFSAVMAAVFGVGLLFTFLTGDPRWMLVKIGRASCRERVYIQEQDATQQHINSDEPSIGGT